jgi:putative component of toxin-antitoxin plasmid stabilization module
VDWIANQPLAGDVIPGAEGARKMRWTGSGRGKRGGLRVIYFAVPNDGVVVLLAVCAKAAKTHLPLAAIRRSKHEAQKSQH